MSKEVTGLSRDILLLSLGISVSVVISDIPTSCCQVVLTSIRAIAMDDQLTTMGYAATSYCG